MTLAVTQVRLPQELIRQTNELVKLGLYTNKSEVIRDALRRLLLQQQIGSIQNSTIDSVQEIRNIRKILSKKKVDIKEINALNQ